MRISDWSSDVCSSDLQKKLFFNLRREKARIAAFEDGDLTPDQVTEIATRLGVNEDEVVSMNRRMSMGGDASLNSPLREEGEGEWQDWLADDTDRKSTRLKLQSLMRISYAVFCLKKKKITHKESNYSTRPKKNITKLQTN